MFWNYLTIIYICWETITDMKTHIIALLLLIGGVLNLFGENLHNFFNRYNWVSGFSWLVSFLLSV